MGGGLGLLVTSELDVEVELIKVGDCEMSEDIWQ